VLVSRDLIAYHLLRDVWKIIIMILMIAGVNPIVMSRQAVVARTRIGIFTNVRVLPMKLLFITRDMMKGISTY